MNEKGGASIARLAEIRHCRLPPEGFAEERAAENAAATSMQALFTLPRPISLSLLSRLSIHLSIHPSVSLSIYLSSIYLSSIYLSSIYPSIHRLSIYLSIYPCRPTSAAITSGVRHRSSTTTRSLALTPTLTLTLALTPTLTQALTLTLS